MDDTSSQLEMSYMPVERTPVDELRARAVRLQSLMREAGLDGLMATQNADVYYLSGTLQQAQVYLPVAGEPVVMVRKHAGRATADLSFPHESTKRAFDPCESCRALSMLRVASRGQSALSSIRCRCPHSTPTRRRWSRLGPGWSMGATFSGG